MGDRDAPTTAGPVVICCAGADADTIRPVVEDLEAQGHMVSLLEGIETSTESLGPAVERLHGEGLYVLCRSKALGRTAVDELRDILLAHHVPFGRTLTVASTRPRELRERIGASLRRLATGKARRMSTVSPDGPPARATQLGMTPPAPAGPRSDPPADPPTAPARTSRATRIGLPSPQPAKTSAAAPPPHKSGTPPPPPPLSASAKAERTPVRADPDDDGLGPEPPANLAPAVEGEPAPVAAALSAAVVIQPDELADLDIDDPGPPSPPTRVVPVRSGSTTVSPVIPRSTLDAIRTGDTAIISREALLAAGLDTSRNSAASAAVPLGNATLGASSSDLAGQTVRATATVLPPDDEETKNPPWLWIGVVAAALLFVGLVALAVSGGDDDADDAPPIAQADPAKGDDTPPTQGGDKAAESGQDDADSPPLGDETPVADSPGPTRVGHALRTRTVRALDVLLVSDTTGPLSWEAAKEHCGGLELAGLDAWRLPQVGELMSLTQAAMTERGYYWSSTSADTFGDTPLVWYAKRNRVITRDRDNLVVCVRGGSAAG